MSNLVGLILALIGLLIMLAIPVDPESTVAPLILLSGILQGVGITLALGR